MIFSFSGAAKLSIGSIYSSILNSSILSSGFETADATELFLETTFIALPLGENEETYLEAKELLIYLEKVDFL
jgi:hypothetical protein